MVINMEEGFELVADKYGRLGLVQTKKAKEVKVETKNIKSIKGVKVKKPVFGSKVLKHKKK